MLVKVPNYASASRRSRSSRIRTQAEEAARGARRTSHEEAQSAKKKCSKVAKTLKREKNTLQICDQTVTSVRCTKREVLSKRLIRCALIFVIVSIVFKVVN